MEKTPSKEQMELVKNISQTIHNLSIKEDEIEICAIIPYSLLKTVLIVSEKHKQWHLVLLLADMIANLFSLIDVIDIPTEAVKEFSEMGIEVT